MNVPKGLEILSMMGPFERGGSEDEGGHRPRARWATGEGAPPMQESAGLLLPK